MELDAIQEINECAICLSNITDEVPLLCCNHLFHVKCILKWYKSQLNTSNKNIPSCPICKCKYDPVNFSKNILKYNNNLINTMIKKLEFIINNNNNNISFINYIRIKLLIINYNSNYNKIKYEKDPLNSLFFNQLVFKVHPNINKLLSNNNFNQENDILINKYKKYNKCFKFLL